MGSGGNPYLLVIQIIKHNNVQFAAYLLTSYFVFPNTGLDMS